MVIPKDILGMLDKIPTLVSHASGDWSSSNAYPEAKSMRSNETTDAAGSAVVNASIWHEHKRNTSRAQFSIRARGVPHGAIRVTQDV